MKTNGAGSALHERADTSSRGLEDLLHQAPQKYFTLGWLISSLQQRSFGIVVLFKQLAVRRIDG
jgi:hypothetical protein